ncbi:2Fe-2S iron-sulfur cluster-binding protein [Methylolobus aquaticus]|uniref:2Fe-2S iron-sulfur cluster-binding protein n=1 Tax=Methylotetracoccus oryzae TaxID=1919059 RepID=UPI00101FAF53|nr:2Fe-2S iron-sulfur cluster-binding protein [Methylotetracoccus oryzae]RYU62069.1 2Fe-2S iron-sulfur cluster binding domain-containing protein [Methylolobus aquaticus]
MSGFLRSSTRRNGKVSVTVLPLGKTFELASGSRLLDAVKLAGDIVTRHCGGRARCGVCHVTVLQGGRGLSKVRKGESDRLALIGGNTLRSRLSCQALLGHHRVTIEWVNH